MSAIGPELPPHLLAKRKRRQEEEVKDEPTASSGAKRSASPAEGDKRRRVMGPAMPPAPLNERPSKPAIEHETSDSDDDDGFGPSLPPTGANTTSEDAENSSNATSNPPDSAPLEAKPKRDDWMMMPPEQDDLAARMDPTKPRARGFNTGKGAKGPNTSEGDNSMWNETPEQKQKRLADEMMGVSHPSSGGPQRPPKDTTARDGQATQQIKEHTVSPTLTISSSISSLTDTFARRRRVGRHCSIGIRRA